MADLAGTLAVTGITGFLIGLSLPAHSASERFSHAVIGGLFGLQAGALLFEALPAILTFSQFGLAYAGALAGTTATVDTALLSQEENVLFSENIVGFSARAESTGETGQGYVNLANGDRSIHILYGDETGGGHLSPGMPGKSAFPADWSAPKVLHEISDVATDPASSVKVGANGNEIVEGTRHGINIRVILARISGWFKTPGGGIVSGFPTNTPKNPK